MLFLSKKCHFQLFYETMLKKSHFVPNFTAPKSIYNSEDSKLMSHQLIKLIDTKIIYSSDLRFSPRLTYITPFLFLFTGSLLTFSFSSSVQAAEFSKILKPYFDYTVMADDNMLRFRDTLLNQSKEQMEQNGFSTERIRELVSQGKTADVLNRFSGGILFEKQISRQRLSAGFNWTYNRYERFHEINNNLLSANGNWHWLLGNRLEGNIGANYRESLLPFIFQPGTKAIRSERSEFINAAWRFHPSWSLNGEYTRYDLGVNSDFNVNADTTQPTPTNTNRFKFLSRSENRFELGLDYLTARQNKVGILFRDTVGEFTNPTVAQDNLVRINSFNQAEVMAKTVWNVTEKSQLELMGGWVNRSNSTGFSGRDFDGFNGRLIYHWQPTEKLGLTLNGWRLTSVMQQLTGSFSLNTGGSIVPSWNITPKIRLEGDFSYEDRQFDRFSIQNQSNLALGRNNTFRNATVRLVYTPQPGLLLSTSIYHSDLHATADNPNSRPGSFNANGVTANLQYIYGKR